MPELLHPGVYALEVPPAVRPIDAVSTSTAAFVGVTDKGPVPGGLLPNGAAAVPPLVTSMTEYERIFGSYRPDSFLTYAIAAFFGNGGKRAYVIRVAGDGAAPAAAGIIQLRAAKPGTWSSLLRITIQDATDGDPAKFDLIVGVPGSGNAVTSIETYKNLSVGVAGNAETKLQTSDFLRLVAQPVTRPGNMAGQLLSGGADGTGGAAATAAVAPLSVEAIYTGAWASDVKVSVQNASNGAAADFDFVVKLKDTEVERFPNLAPGAANPPQPANYGRSVVNAGSAYVNITADFTARPGDAADVALSNGADAPDAVPGTFSSLGYSAANDGGWGNSITAAISDSADRDENNFKLTVFYGGQPVETFAGLTYQGSPTLASGATNPADYGRIIVNSRSEYIAITADFDARPSNTTPLTLLNGSDGGVVGAAGYEGAAATSSTLTGSGLHALDKVTDVNLLAIPGQGDPELVNAGLDYCFNRALQDIFFIGDVGALSPADARRTDAATDVTQQSDVVAFATTGFQGTALDKAAGQFGAVYYPWVWAVDPIGTGINPRILLPPSGFLAGIYARTDNARGVFKAPAGTEAGVSGALAPAVVVNDGDQDQLNPVSINVIRTVPGSGLVVWGTRTIGSDPSWRYIPVRRMAILLRVSIYYGIQWAVFEPNDEPLWSSLRLSIRSFMLTQFRAGAFQGATPDDAFFVKCDSSTTTQSDIDNGIVNILVGFAPLKPAEFVILKLSQKVNQPT
jgi:phage tail sheath protein FI